LHFTVRLIDRLVLNVDVERTIIFTSYKVTFVFCSWKYDDYI